MPTYEYECQKCKKHLEEFQSITAEALKKCPSCKGKLKRLLGSGSGFLFKGSGFYITDYRSKSYNEAKKQDKPAEKEKAKSSDKPSPDSGKEKSSTDSKKDA